MDPEKRYSVIIVTGISSVQLQFRTGNEERDETDVSLAYEIHLYVNKIIY